MKTIRHNLVLILCGLIVGLAIPSTLPGQEYGKTLNLGLGIGHYGYVKSSPLVLHVNYEFDVAKDFTLAPFMTIYSYHRSGHWGDPKDPSNYYNYRQTVIPIGVKGSYYFDELFQAGPKWDFYLAGSLGFAIRATQWDDEYYGDEKIQSEAGPLYLDLHVGTEYHFNSRLGIYLDLSSGLSTIGVAIHGRN